jgi:YVTN family beta-propeller protein
MPGLRELALPEECSDDVRELSAACVYDVMRVRELCVFTTHTPVEAGHERFPYPLVEQLLGDFMAVDQLKLVGGADDLNMTRVALNLSGYVNGVAERHAETSRRMFKGFRFHAITQWHPRLDKTIATGPLPNYAVISGDGTKIYVSNAGNDTVSEVDAAHGIVLRNIVVGASPEHLVLAPDGRRLYVANVNDGTVSAIALPAGEVAQTLQVGGLLHGLDLAQDGQTLFVSARETNELVAVDLESGTMKRQALEPQPYHLTAGSGRIYVTSGEAPKLWVLDAGSLEVLREIPLRDIGHQVVVAEPTAWERRKERATVRKQPEGR